jgi:cytochrome P450
LKNLVPSEAAQETHKFFEVSLKKLTEREAAEVDAEAGEKSTRKDIFHYLFRSRDPETGLGFSREQLHADSALFIAAGADGVAVTISAAMFYLLKNPATLEKLTRELRSSFTSLEDIKTPKLNELPYLSAVVDETFRISPGAPSAFPREILRGGLTVDNMYIPAGVVVGISPYSIHHNEAYFPDSFAFQPERWLNKEEKIKRARSAMFTFSTGPNNCIGKGLAILATKIVLARMLYKYDVKAPEGKITGGGEAGKELWREREDEYQMWDWVVGYRSGPNVQLKARK